MDSFKKVPLYSNLTTHKQEGISPQLQNLSQYISIFSIQHFKDYIDNAQCGIFCIEANNESSHADLFAFARFNGRNTHKIFFLPEPMEYLKYNLIDHGATDVFTAPYDFKLINSKLKVLCHYITLQENRSEVLRFNNITIIPNKMEINFDDGKEKTPIPMTPTQFKILYFLAQDPGKIRSRKEIMENTIGIRNKIMERNVDTHISKIRKQLGNEKNTIVSVHGQGYKFATA